MNTLSRVGVLSASIFCTSCKETKREVVRDVLPMNQRDVQSMTQGIRSQYETILKAHNTQESLIARLSDNNATLVMTLQNNTITQVQLTLRNLYPNSPDMAPTPYTDIHGDGTLETYPADLRTLPNSSLTYGNYLALLTRFSVPQEVIQEKPIPPKNSPKNSQFDIARDAIPPSPEIFSRIVR